MPKPESCVDCPFYSMGHDFSAIEIGSNYERARLLLVGEASGEAEAREGLPFRPYAQSGSLLADAMRQTNILRSEVAITNVLRCRPKNDWLEGHPQQYRATQHCISNHLFSAIGGLKPNAILALGGTAFRCLTQPVKGRYGTLDYARGYVVRGHGAAEGIPVIGTYHPAHLRRGASHLTPLLQRDLRRAFLLAQGRMVEGKHYILSPTDAAARGLLRYLTTPTTDEAEYWVRQIEPDCAMAYDIETPLSTRSDEDERTSFADRDIKLVQFSQKRGEGIALPFRDDYRGIVRSAMHTARRKVGHNCWNFDDPVLEANGIDVGITDDTLAMFTVYWSDLPKNLQACAQMAGFPFRWKELGETNLEFYGCADADATIWTYEYMVKVLSGG